MIEASRAIYFSVHPHFYEMLDFYIYTIACTPFRRNPSPNVNLRALRLSESGLGPGPSLRRFKLKAPVALRLANAK